MYGEYLHAVYGLLREMKESQGETIQQAAELVGDTVIAGGLVHTFGSGHSQLLAREIQSRAGGLYPIVHIPDPLWGRAERVEGVGEVLLKNWPLKSGEPLFVISNSGRNPEPIEVAILAKERGMHVIAVTSLPHSEGVSSRHSSGKKLYEVAELVLDTGAPPGDACLSFESLAIKAGATSTVLGAALLNAVMIEAIQYILDQGETPPVLMSANLDGADAHNARVRERYEDVARLGALHPSI